MTTRPEGRVVFCKMCIRDRYITDDTVSVAVAAPAEGLSEADAALISDVVCSQTDYPLSQVRIIEVKP